MIRAAIYVRVSTPQQALEDKHSLPFQEKTLKSIAEARAKAEGTEWVTETIREVDSAGRGADGLPKLTHLLKRIENGHFDRLMVFSLDRLSRGEPGDTDKIFRTLAAAGCCIETPEKPIDPRDDTDLFFGHVQGLLSSFEYRRIWNRTYGTVEKIANEGSSRMGHTIPFGYKLDWNEGKSTVVVNELEAAVIRRAYELFLGGVGGPNAVTTKLTQEGYTARHGRPLRPQVVRYWLSNPRYAGYEFRRAEHSRWQDCRKRRQAQNKKQFARSTHPVFRPSQVWPAIITLEQWQKGRDIQKTITKDRCRPSSSPMGGILKCQSCGFSMVSFTHMPDRTLYYRCKNRALNKACKEIPIRQDEAHYAVHRWIRKVVSGAVPMVETAPSTDEGPAIDARLEEIHSTETKLLDKMLKYPEMEQAIVAKFKELRDEKDSLIDKRKRVPRIAHAIKRQPIPLELVDACHPDTNIELFYKLVRSLLSCVMLEKASSKTYRVRGQERTRKTFRVVKAKMTTGELFTMINRESLPDFFGLPAQAIPVLSPAQETDGVLV